ncbi:hypothetical protein EPO15_11800 [bacterium]|nr:MAG: hypothetical protein EPO15_11800 [bacterium]
MMRLMMALMPSCRELKEVLAGEGLASLPWHRRMTAKMHLSRCELCGRFARQLERIAEALRLAWTKPNEADVAPLKQRIVARLRNP